MNALRRVFRREHLITLLLILAAVLVLFDFGSSWFSPAELIVALLGLLAVDQLIEKIGYFERIELSLSRINREVSGSKDPETIFGNKGRAESFDSFIEDAKEVWIAAKSLTRLLNAHGKNIERAAKRGTKFKFIVHNTNNEHQVYAVSSNSIFVQDEDAVRDSIKTSLSYLRRLNARVPRGRIKGKYAPAPLYNGYTIVDGDERSAKIYIEYFGFRISLEDRLVCQFSREESERLYDYHRQQYGELWRRGSNIDLN